MRVAVASWARVGAVYGLNVCMGKLQVDTADLLAKDWSGMAGVVELLHGNSNETATGMGEGRAPHERMRGREHQGVKSPSAGSFAEKKRIMEQLTWHGKVAVMCAKAWQGWQVQLIGEQEQERNGHASCQRKLAGVLVRRCVQMGKAPQAGEMKGNRPHAGKG